MKAAHKNLLKAQGKTAKDIKAIESICRRAKDLLSDCSEQNVRIVMHGRKVVLACGNVELAEIPYVQ